MKSVHTGRITSVSVWKDSSTKKEILQVSVEIDGDTNGWGTTFMYDFREDHDMIATLGKRVSIILAVEGD